MSAQLDDFTTCLDLPPARSGGLRAPQTHFRRPSFAPRATQDHLRTAQEPPKSRQEGLRRPQGPPRGPPEAPGGPPEPQNTCKNSAKPMVFTRLRKTLQLAAKSGPRAPKGGPGEAQEAPRTLQERSGPAQERPKSHPEWPQRLTGAAQDGPWTFL